MAYHNPIYSTYTLPASAISSAGTKLSVTGPRGHTGALIGISAVVTTNTTTAASEVRVGTASAHSKYGTLSVPVATAGADAVFNDADINPVDANLMPADTTVLIASDGGSDAGAADLTVTIAWFK